MFWDCLTCDYGFYFMGSKETHPNLWKKIMADHEIYHNLWLGLEIDVNGDVIVDGVPNPGYDRRADSGLENVVRRAGKRYERRASPPKYHLRKALGTQDDP